MRAWVLFFLLTPASANVNQLMELQSNAAYGKWRTQAFRARVRARACHWEQKRRRPPLHCGIEAMERVCGDRNSLWTLSDLRQMLIQRGLSRSCRHYLQTLLATQVYQQRDFPEYGPSFELPAEDGDTNSARTNHL